MNKVILSGHFVAEPAIRYTQTGKAVANFRIGVNDGYGEKQKSYFINCVAWQKTAEFIGNHFSKGNAILIEGRITSRSYESNDGQKKYITEVIVEQAEFMGGSKKQDSAPPTAQQAELGSEIYPDEEIPF